MFQHAIGSILPTCEIVILYVLQNPKGPMDEEMHALKYLESFIDSCGDGEARPSLCCIVNIIDKDELDTPWEDYCSEVTHQISSTLQRPNTVVEFVPRIPRHDLQDFEGTVMKNLQKQLITLVTQKLGKRRDECLNLARAMRYPREAGTMANILPWEKSSIWLTVATSRTS